MLFTETSVPQFIAEMSDTRFFGNEKNVAQMLLQALQKNDIVKLEWFSQFGRDVYKIVSNVNTHLHQLQFGFTNFSFNVYGWLNSPVWNKREKIEFPVRPENYCRNSIDLAEGINGLWSWGYSYCTGNDGGGGRASEFCAPCNNREEAIKKSVDYLLKCHSDAKEHVGKYGDSCHNYKKDYSDKVIEAINTYLKPKQLSLF